MSRSSESHAQIVEKTWRCRKKNLAHGSRGGGVDKTTERQLELKLQKIAAKTKLEIKRVANQIKL